MLSFLGVVFVSSAFAAPWAWLLYRRSPDKTLEAFFERVCLGYAIAFVVLFVAAQFRLWLFAPLWAASAIAALVFGVRAPKQERMRVGVDGWLLLGCAVVYLALRALPFGVRTLPLGWDAYFHMTIAESIFVKGRAVHDWLPYENIPLNYPIGSHLLLALAQWSTGLRPHVFFDPLIVWFTLLSGFQLFSLMSRATGDRRVACYAALSYLFLANFGSLQYVMWSGLPNLIGMYVFLGLLTALAQPAASLPRATLVFATYFLAACFVHHHVMVTAGLCLIWTTGVMFVTGDRPRAKRIAMGLLASGVLGLPYFLMYLRRSATLGNTEISRYMERAADAWSIAQDLGLGFSLLVVAGIYLYFKNREQVDAAVMQPLVAMLGLYVLVEFVVRTLSATLFHNEMSPFTPSRFVTDAVTLLSVFAGIVWRTVQGDRERHRIPIAAMIVAGLFVFNRSTYRNSFKQAVPHAKLEAYDWIRTNADPGAAVLEPDFRATYLTQRMASGFPLPTSEYASLAENRILLKEVASGKQRLEVLNRQVLTVAKPGAKAPRGKVLWENGAGFRIVERAAVR